MFHLDKQSFENEGCIEIDEEHSEDDDDEYCDDYFNDNKKSKTSKSHKSKSQSKQINRKADRKQKNNDDTSLREEEERQEEEDQLFSPFQKRTLKSTKRTFAYTTNKNNNSGEGLKSYTKPPPVQNMNATYDIQENNIEEYDQELPSTNLRNNENFARKAKESPNSSLVEKSLDKSSNLFDDYKSPPKVRRLSSENIPTPLRAKRSPNNDDVGEKITTSRNGDDDDSMDNSIWKISNMKETKKEGSQQGGRRDPFVEGMFSPPTPLEQRQSGLSFHASNKRSNSSKSNRLKERKIFSPPNSKKLLDESDFSQRHEDGVGNKSKNNSTLISKEHETMDDETNSSENQQFRNFETPKQKTLTKSFTDQSNTIDNENSRKVTHISDETPRFDKNNTPKLPSTIKPRSQQTDSNILRHDPKSSSSKNLNFETPLKTDFAPMAQSTAFREERVSVNSSNRNDSNSKSSTLISHTLKDSINQTNTHVVGVGSTPKTTRQNVNVRTPPSLGRAEEKVAVKYRPPVIMTSRLTKKHMVRIQNINTTLGVV